MGDEERSELDESLNVHRTFLLEGDAFEEILLRPIIFSLTYGALPER